MTAASDIITLAYREANFKNALGTPTTEEFAEGLTLLQSLVDSLFGLIVGTKMKPWHIPTPQRTSSVAANYPALPGDRGVVSALDVAHPPSNTRLVVRAIEETTVYFQYHPEDGATMEYVDAGQQENITLDGNGALFGLSGSNEQVEITALFPTGRNAPRRWIYRADYGAWLEITALDLASDVPFPAMFDDYFVTALAIRLSPRFGAEPRQVTVMRYREMSGFIRLQYLQTREQIVGNAGVPSEQSYWGRGYGFQRFDDGSL
jgi:hypothetical protein